MYIDDIKQFAKYKNKKELKKLKLTKRIYS